MKRPPIDLPFSKINKAFYSGLPLNIIFRHSIYDTLRVYVGISKVDAGKLTQDLL